MTEGENVDPWTDTRGLGTLTPVFCALATIVSGFCTVMVDYLPFIVQFLTFTQECRVAYVASLQKVFCVSELKLFEIAFPCLYSCAGVHPSVRSVFSHCYLACGFVACGSVLKLLVTLCFRPCFCVFCSWSSSSRARPTAHASAPRRWPHE